MSLTSEPLESVGHVSGSLDQIKRWFRKTVGAAEERIDGGSPVATPPPDATSVGTGGVERETSTNAQTEGGTDEPWPGNT